MASKRVGPEAKIIALFTALPEDSKRIVLDVIKSLNAAPRKASKKATTSTPADKSPSVEVSEGLCAHRFENNKPCLAAADNAIHDSSFSYAGYHPFVPTAPSVTGRSSRKKSSTKASESSVASSETPPDSVGNAVQEVSGD